MAKKAKAAPGTGDEAIAASIDNGIEPSNTGFTAPGGTRAMFTLTAAALKLLDTAVLVDGHDRSAIVEGLITTHLSGYFSGK
jgi:hypothetical protein